MKIAYDYKIFWNQKHGGISRYFLNLFIHFQKKKENFKVFAPFFKNEYLRDFLKENVEGIYIKDNIPFTSNLIKIYNEKMNSIKINLWKPDLTHYTYYYENIIKKNTSVITVYDLIHEIVGENQNKIVRPKKKMLEISDHIICISENTKKDLLNFYNIDEKKISVIYLGGDHLQKNSIYSVDKFTNQIPYILFVGSRVKYKNFEFLIKGYAKSNRLMNNINILLFGGGKLTKEEKKTFATLQISENKIIQTDGDDNLLSALYNQAKAFVFPSLYEGFGLPLIESLNNNCPIVCSDIPIFKEILGDNAYFFESNNYDSLIKSLEDIVFSNNSNLDQKKIDFLKKKYTWQKCSEDTLNLYNKII